MAFFPLFIDLCGKEVLAIGAGYVGSRRIETLVSFGAAVTVVDPRPSASVKQLADSGKIKLIQTGYSEYRYSNYKDTEGSFLVSYYIVLTATGDLKTDLQAADDGKRAGAFVNVAGAKERSDFYFPGIASGGKITAGVIGDGSDHRLAKKATKEVGDFLKQTYDNRDDQE